MDKIQNDPQVVEFVHLMAEKNFSAMKKMLDEGFNPNSCYESWEHFSYDNGEIDGGWAIISRRLIELDWVNDCPALKKLLEHYGAKTERQESWERYMAERAAEEAEVDRLLNE